MRDVAGKPVELAPVEISFRENDAFEEDVIKGGRDFKGIPRARVFD